MIKKEMGFEIGGRQIKIKEFENRYSVLLPLDLNSCDDEWSEFETDREMVHAYADKTMKYLVDEGFIDKSKTTQVHIAVKK